MPVCRTAPGNVVGAGAGGETERPSCAHPARTAVNRRAARTRIAAPTARPLKDVRLVVGMAAVLDVRDHDGLLAREDGVEQAVVSDAQAQHAWHGLEPLD